MERSKISELRDQLRSLRKQELEIEAQILALEDEEPNADKKTSDKLSNEEIRRYSRQLLIPEVGTEGQLKLRNSSVLVVGTGGLGSPCALYLAAMGIGRLGLVDHDVVDQSNLHRQVLHTEASCGSSKVLSAITSLSRLSSLCDTKVYDVLLDSTNARDIISGYDIVVDATDNAATRYLINDACVLSGIPLVSGSAVRLDGQLT
ncbi:hypothetical protein LPJ73_008066, partial [Coemansia sp. RSA 2703]